MTFDEIELGRVYRFRFGGKGDYLLGECRADCHQIYKYLRTFDGMNVELCHRITDLTPIPTREEWEEIVGLLRDAHEVLQCTGKYYVGNGRHLATLDEKIAAALAKVKPQPTQPEGPH